MFQFVAGVNLQLDRQNREVEYCLPSGLLPEENPLTVALTPFTCLTTLPVTCHTAHMRFWNPLVLRHWRGIDHVCSPERARPFGWPRRADDSAIHLGNGRNEIYAARMMPHRAPRHVEELSSMRSTLPTAFS